jgi:hypothetical protein
MKSSPIVERIVWAVAVLLVAASLWRLRAAADPYRPQAPLTALDDRREYHFRNLTFAATRGLFDRLLQEAARAPDPATRARYLARVAALQRERGMSEAAETAAREALRTAPGDVEVQRLLSVPLDLQNLR